MCLNGRSIASVSNELHIGKVGLSKDLKDVYNYTALPDGKKKINSEYFSKIETKEKAYWLGFFFADGYNNGISVIEFCLKDEDKYAVENFKKALGSQHEISPKIVDGFMNWRIIFHDKKMSSDLSKLHAGHLKTYSMTMPSLNDDLISHFLRGYFDGDGCISIRKRDNMINFYLTSASLKMLEEVKDIISHKLNIPIHIYKNHNNWVLCAHGKYAIKLFDWIYADSTENTRLNRKYIKYLFTKHCHPEIKVA